MNPFTRIPRLFGRVSVRLLGIAATGVAVGIAIAGCGGSSGQTTSQPATQTGSQASSSVPEAELTVQSSHYGPTIFDSHHRVLYQFAADHTNKSTCYGDCAKAWPPMLTNGQPKAISGLDSSLLGTTTRRDGSEQVTYAGHPLYYFSEDKPGKIMCQHVKLHGGFWYVVKPNGEANTAQGTGMM
jgi:predicted lipoprotein with Yx(FWY)xxD motif